MNADRRKKSLHKQAEWLQQRLVTLRADTDRFSQYRLYAFLAIFIVGMPLFFSVGPALFWPVAGLLGLLFVALVASHRRKQLSLNRHELALRRKGRQLARQAVDWSGLPPYRGPDTTPEHPFAADIDLAGDHSFHQLVSQARTKGGHECLFQWLSQPATPIHEALERQQAVRELLPLTVLRQRLVLAADLAADESGEWDTERLLAWTRTENHQAQLRRWLTISGMIALVNIVLFLADIVNDAPPLWLASFGLYALAAFSQTQLLAPVFAEAAGLQDAFRQLTASFATLEKFNLGARPRLQALCQPFQRQGQRPSDYLRRVAAVVNATALRNNPLLWIVINAILPWDLFFAFRLSQVKADVATQLPDWLDRYYQLEAYSSLADYAYLNPEYSWPTLTDTEEPTLCATRLGHPLLPGDARVTNDFELVGQGAMALITGSNMSGKSTFLRTLGLNVVVGLAGGPVVADLMTVSPIRLFSSIKVSDSVTDGISYFYAEVRRLRALLDAIENEVEHRPVFFLIDEIFRGTNNEERRLGSEALIRALSQSTAFGLVSTHDLGLIPLADELTTVQNYHFRDEIVGDTMHFDYQLRPGPSPTTNALHIMRTAGLPVPTAETTSP